MPKDVEAAEQAYREWMIAQGRGEELAAGKTFELPPAPKPEVVVTVHAQQPIVPETAFALVEAAKAAAEEMSGAKAVATPAPAKKKS